MLDKRLVILRDLTKIKDEVAPYTIQMRLLKLIQLNKTRKLTVNKQRINASLVQYVLHKWQVWIGTIDSGEIVRPSENGHRGGSEINK